ncbi:M16 family metallopeptidase [Parerythrobacter jejuensis]|nr:insulinase family protein [Parerythrobacter jejuensis]
MGCTPKTIRTVSTFALALGLASAALTPAWAQAAGQAEAASTSRPAQSPVWGIVSQEIEADADIRFGVLANGMRYALKRNTNPSGEAAIRFTVKVGNREETDAESGAAHFIEHMAFNGTTNIPEGQLLPMLERLGLAFGADTNAETSLDYTTYKLSLPNTDEATVDTGLMVIREMAGEMTIAPEAVERERGILLSEAQVRNDPQRRRAASYFGAALPGSRIGQRINANVERIREISANELREFYEGYYRPERSTLAIVGDFDVDAMEKKIRAQFGDWNGKGEARDIYIGPVPDGAQPLIATFVDPAIPEFIELQRLSEWTPSQNTVAESREQFLRLIASIALSNRINALSRSADAPTLGGQASEQPLFRTAQSFGLMAIAKDGQWRDTLALAEQELRRADQYGFTASEIAEAKANIETALANAAAQAAGRTSVAIAESLVQDSLNNGIPTSPETNLALYRMIAPTVTPQAVSAAFSEAWDGGPSVVHISTKSPIEGGQATIAAALSESAKVAVSAPVEAAAVEFAYSDWGVPGKVVADDRIADLGIRTVRFENGLQLNLKRTEFEPGKVGFSMRVGSGLSTFPANKPGLKEMLPIAMQVDGLEAHDPDELRRVLAGRAVSQSLSPTNGALVASGGTTPDDLKLQLDLLAARLTATAWRAETQAQWAGVAPVLVKNITSSPVPVFINAMNAVLGGGDTRLGLPDASRLEDITLSDLQAAVASQLGEGPISLGLVGDFDEDAAIEAVASTLGTLPSRGERREQGAEIRPLSFVADTSPKILTHSGAADQGALAVSWQTDDAGDLRDNIVRDLLAAAIGLRLTETLREEQGATYSPEAFSYAQRTFDGFGHITAFATVPMQSMDDVANVIRSIASEFSNTAISEDLLERARNPIRERYERATTQNSAWLGLVAMAQSDSEVLDRRRNRMAVLESVTPADIRSAARKYLADTPGVEIRVIPETGAN